MAADRSGSSPGAVRCADCRRVSLLCTVAAFVCRFCFSTRGEEACKWNSCGCCLLSGAHPGDCTNQRGHGLSARYVHTCAATGVAPGGKP